MDTLKLSIEKIKNIDKGEIEIPLENGVYALVGTNGCGKSTILLAMAQLISTHYLGTLKQEDFSDASKISFDIDGKIDIWSYNKERKQWTSNLYPKIMKLNGMYEGSLFYGTRFNDSTRIDSLLKHGKLKSNEIVDADEYVIDKLSFILHGDYEHYRNLKRVKNKYITQRINVNNTPYFNEVNQDLISQYRMSSGECLLISLLHFLYNSIERKSLPTNEKILVLIDEIELALHPIAVTRLVDLLNELVKKHKNLVVLLSSHSPEVIKNIKPANLYKVTNKNGQLTTQSNCYPSYLIRDVYDHDGFDFLLLVEDKLAKYLVDKILLKHNFKSGKLIHVVPVGGWSQTLYLHKDLLRNNILGLGKTIISILDGDIKDEVSDEYKDIKKLFLPIASIEKYLYSVIIDSPNNDILKVLNDKYFTIKSIDTLIKEFSNKYPDKKNLSEKDKKFYFRLRKDLEERNITEDYFINNLCDDLFNNVDFSVFTTNLKKMLQ
ncbi:MAG: AAA family ATPase [Prevotellaceae bacterium]|jgi:predicted ATP-dependent endonuclease of OLD family|nr:AAA family ATPase [Prevotellaceae bacterium]